jgi:hypothetical protein
MAGPSRCLAIRELQEGQPSLTLALVAISFIQDMVQSMSLKHENKNKADPV